MQTDNNDLQKRIQDIEKLLQALQALIEKRTSVLKNIESIALKRVLEHKTTLLNVNGRINKVSFCLRYANALSVHRKILLRNIFNLRIRKKQVEKTLAKLQSGEQQAT